LPRHGGHGLGYLRPRQAAGGDGFGARGGGQAGGSCRQRPLAAAEVRGDALHQVAPLGGPQKEGQGSSGPWPSFSFSSGFWRTAYQRRKPMPAAPRIGGRAPERTGSQASAAKVMVPWVGRGHRPAG